VAELIQLYVLSACVFQPYEVISRCVLGDVGGHLFCRTFPPLLF